MKCPMKVNSNTIELQCTFLVIGSQNYSVLISPHTQLIQLGNSDNVKLLHYQCAIKILKELFLRVVDMPNLLSFLKRQFLNSGVIFFNKQLSQISWCSCDQLLCKCLQKMIEVKELNVYFLKYRYTFINEKIVMNCLTLKYCLTRKNCTTWNVYR